MSDTNREYLECQCSHPSCLIAAEVFSPNSKDDPELILSLQLNHYAPWYKRVYYGLRYILGLRNDVYYWSETIVAHDSVRRLHTLLGSYIILQKLREASRKKRACQKS